MKERLARNIKIAVKSVFFHYKQYLCFFIALFVIQMFYGIVTVAHDNYINIEYNHVYSEYNYHILLKDMNEDQYIYLINGGEAILLSDQIYEITEIKSWDDETAYNRRYDIYIRFTGDDPNADYEHFKTRFGTELASLSDEGSVRYTTTPVLNFDEREQSNTLSYIGIAVVVTLLSVLLLTSLYDIRINHYKYTYGIYMTFGADFMKLFETSFWEMMVVAATSLIPATVCSALFDFIVLTMRGESFVFRVSSIFKVMVFSLLTAAFAVIYPIWRVSRRTPVTLIVAEDNSNLVVSPRQSFEMYGISYPKKYELFSWWRFRKYYLKLFAAAVLFAGLAVSGAAVSSIYTQELDEPAAQFELTFSEEGYAYSYDGAEMKDELYAIDGVEKLEKDASVTAKEVKSYLTVSSSDTKAFANLVVFDDEEGFYVTDDAEYHAYDAEVAEMLERYDYDGDLYAPLEKDGMVVLSDSINDSVKFKLKPGDTVRCAVYTDKIRDPDENLTGRELLKARMKYYYFDYVELTVAAVIHDDPTFEYMNIYLTSSDYQTVTGSAPEFRSVGIYMADGVTSDQVRSTEDALREWADIYGNITVTNTHAASIHSIEYGKGIGAQLSAVAILIMAISPLMWFFSQVIFCRKRENEFYVLEMFGSTEDKIRWIYIWDGLFCAAAGAVFCVIFSIIGNAAVHAYPIHDIRVSNGLPPLAFTAALLATAACGFLSSYIPYLLYVKERRRRSIAEDTGERT